MNAPRKAFGKRPSPKAPTAALPPVASAYAIAESTVREWTGRGPLTAAQRESVARIAAE